MTPVKSSNIKACHHDGTDFIVEFNNGHKWRYFGADAKYHAGMVGAASAGKYFNTHIRDLKGERVVEKKS